MPRDPSPEVYRGVRDAYKILVLSDRTRSGKAWSRSSLFGGRFRETVYFPGLRPNPRGSLFGGPSWTPPGRTPILRDSPAGQQTFGISGHGISKSFKKSRAARARNATKNGQKRDFAPSNAKREGPVKMTYSIPDFLSRHEANVTTDSLFGGPARESVYLRPGSCERVYFLTPLEALLLDQSA